jgi:hypothetical protein
MELNWTFRFQIQYGNELALKYNSAVWMCSEFHVEIEESTQFQILFGCTNTGILEFGVLLNLNNINLGTCKKELDCIYII